jgi:hypothetical protein
MANLIITIISIALVAVAAIMGAYYGGTAFLQGQAKAKAVRVINAAEQITSALNVYSANHGGARGMSRSDLLNGYLTEIPNLDSVLPSFYDTDTDPSMIGFYCSSFEAGSIDCQSETWDRLTIPTQSREICTAISAVALGPNVTLAYHGTDNYNVPGNQKFGCFNNGDNDYIFVYKVY